MKRWVMAPAATDRFLARLEEETGLSRLACQLLHARGVTEADQARAYLAPSLSALHDPLEMKGMSTLVERLVAARRSGKAVAVMGDYDVDGVVSTALYTKVLRSLGFDVRPFVPHRMKHGYGVAWEALQGLAAGGAQVVLTTDTGISAFEEVRRGREELGLEILITDHHTPPEVLPPAAVIVNPKQEGCGYPFRDLSGAGIAFKVLHALLEALGASHEALLLPHLDLVALATVADVVPLRGENRVLVAHGLKMAARTRSVGLAALLEAAGAGAAEVTERTFGWTLGPRINAAGRIGDASLALELLLTEDEGRARCLAAELERLNARRREIEARILDEALERVERMDLSGRSSLVLAEPPERSIPWHPGVLGIVAARLVERFGLPCMMLGRDERTGAWKGSGRAPQLVERMDLHGILSRCGAHLSAFGGHRYAAGATLLGTTEEAIAAFEQAFGEAAASQMAPGERVAGLRVDLEMSLGPACRAAEEVFGRFAPFGNQNEQVCIVARGAEIVSARAVGQGRRHLKLGARQDGVTLQGIGFGLAEVFPSLLQAPLPRRVDIVFHVTMNSWRGEVRQELSVKDLRLLDASPGSPVKGG